jgi:sensor domain CHASE-containing protein
MNYERDMNIDESALDVEWLEQSSLVMKYARHEAEAEKAKDLSKENLDLVRAKLDKDVRSNPESYGIEKITETVVSNTIITQDEYRTAYAVYLEANFNYSLAKNAMKAVVQRKDALENLVRLHGQNYFAGPKIPRDITKERLNRDATREANNKKVKRLRKK